MASTSFTSLFGEHPDVRVVEFLARHPDFDYTITELARNAGTSRPATYKVVERLLANGVLQRTRRVGSSTFYRLNGENRLVQPLLNMGPPLSQAPRGGRRVRAGKEVRR